MVLQVVTARQYDPIFIIPIIFNIHINPLQKFTQCVILLKNKISQPTTRDLPLGGAGLGDYWSKAEIVGNPPLQALVGAIYFIDLDQDLD